MHSFPWKRRVTYSPLGHSFAPGFEEVQWDPDAVSVPLQLAADEEVIAPGEKSSENYQIVKGVSETKACPQGCPRGTASGICMGWHECMDTKGRGFRSSVLVAIQMGSQAQFPSALVFLSSDPGAAE